MRRSPSIDLSHIPESLGARRAPVTSTALLGQEGSPSNTSVGRRAPSPWRPREIILRRRFRSNPWRLGLGRRCLRHAPSAALIEEVHRFAEQSTILRVEEICRAMHDASTRRYNSSRDVVQAARATGEEPDANGPVVRALGITNDESQGSTVGLLARRPGALKGVIRLGLGGIGDTACENWRESVRLVGVCETTRNHLAGREKTIARGRPGHRRVLSPRRLAAGKAAQDQWSN